MNDANNEDIIRSMIKVRQFTHRAILNNMLRYTLLYKHKVHKHIEAEIDFKNKHI